MGTGAPTPVVIPVHAAPKKAPCPECGKHGRRKRKLTPRRVRTVLEAWADRTVALRGMPGIKQVYCFENRGEEIGVTLGHPHGQIYAYPFVPTPLSTMIRVARRLGRCQHCDAVAAEESDGARLVASTDAWVAFVPYAARWPGPRRRRSSSTVGPPRASWGTGGAASIKTWCSTSAARAPPISGPIQYTS